MKRSRLRRKVHAHRAVLLHLKDVKGQVDLSIFEAWPGL